MRRGVLQWIALLVTCELIPGCLLNSVHPIIKAPQTKPDSAHAIVVIGVGLDVVWPFTEFPLTLDEYSGEKQGITGNCFHYNRIEATRPSIPAKVTYLAYEVPANIYVYSGRNANATLAPSSMGRAFRAPPGATVISETTYLSVIRQWNFGETSTRRDLARGFFFRATLY